MHEGILYSHKNENLPFAKAWMEVKVIIFRETCWEKKDKYGKISFINDI